MFPVIDFSALSAALENPTAFSVFYAFLLSFVLGSAIAVGYIKTFRGLSYSRNFLHCLVLFPILMSIAMQAIGDNVARGIGMVGTVSLLRFRTEIKDPRDMIFIFSSLAVGLAAGVHAHVVAVLGTACFLSAVFVLSRTPFAHGPQYDAMLRLNLGAGEAQQKALEAVLNQHCRNFNLISLREMGQGNVLDFSYHVKFKDAGHREALVQDIKSIEGAKAVNLLMQDAIVEV
jgi:uncharacterized membrane protein YhiD involved in acid resistance